LKILKKSYPEVISSVKVKFVEAAIRQMKPGLLILLLRNDDIMTDCQNLSESRLDLNLRNFLVKVDFAIPLDCIGRLLDINSGILFPLVLTACLRNKNDNAEKIKEFLLQNFSLFCQKNTKPDLWHIAYCEYLSNELYVEPLICLFDYLKENHLEILKAKNSLEMNLLMYAIDTKVWNPVSINYKFNPNLNKDLDQVFLVSHMIDSLAR